jgi:hypothetical protein
LIRKSNRGRDIRLTGASGVRWELQLPIWFLAGRWIWRQHLYRSMHIQRDATAAVPGSALL